RAQLQPPDAHNYKPSVTQEERDEDSQAAGSQGPQATRISPAFSGSFLRLFKVSIFTCTFQGGVQQIHTLPNTRLVGLQTEPCGCANHRRIPSPGCLYVRTFPRGSKREKYIAALQQGYGQQVSKTILNYLPHKSKRKVMNAPPPAYSLVDQHPDRRRHSHSVNYAQPTQQAINQPARQSGTQSRLGRSSQSLYIHPGRSSQSFHIHPSRTNRPSTASQSQPADRGLGSLIVGLGAASALNGVLNSNTQPQSTYPSGEDPLAILARYDTILLIDDSASMNQQGRWNEAAIAVAGLADTLVRYDNGLPISPLPIFLPFSQLVLMTDCGLHIPHDCFDHTDGIDVYFMNSVEHVRNATSAADVSRLFQRVQPIGRSTPTDVRVEELLSIYLDRLDVGKASNLAPIKPLNLIVITDGEADDPDTLAYALAGFSDRLEEGRFPLNQLGVQFIQIGNDREATKFLKYLDDELRSNSSRRRDIVDTTPYQGSVTTEFLIKALLGGINKRIDHQRGR
ncbi:hypothetical protein VP01_2941g2, partial [Puccinia sorghi]